MKKNMLLFLWCFCWGIVLQAQSISSVVPSQNPVYEGANLFVDISGTNTHFAQGSGTTVSVNVGGTHVNGYVMNINSDTSMSGFFYIPCGICGSATLTATNSIDGAMSFTNAFNVDCAQILSVQPDTINSGQTLAVTVSGTGIDFSQGTWFNGHFYNSSTGNYVYPSGFNNATANSIDANVTFPGQACGGYYDFCITSPGCQTCLPNAVYINNTSNAQLTAVSPSTATTGQLLTVGISGTGVDFTQGSLTAYVQNSSTGQAYNFPNHIALSTDSLNAYGSLPSHLCDGVYDVCVTAGGSCPVCLPNAMTVNNASTAQIVSISEDTIIGDGSPLSVTVSGADINFFQGTIFDFYITNNAGNTVHTTAHWPNNWQNPNQTVTYFQQRPTTCGTYDFMIVNNVNCTFDTVIYPNAIVVDQLYNPDILNVSPSSATVGQLLTVTLGGNGDVNFLQSSANIQVRLVHQVTGHVLMGTNLTAIPINSSLATVDFNLGPTDCGTYDLIVDSLDVGCNTFVSKTYGNPIVINSPNSPQLQSTTPNVTLTGQPITMTVTASNIDFNFVGITSIYLEHSLSGLHQYPQSITPNPSNPGEAVLTFGPMYTPGIYNMVVNNLQVCGNTSVTWFAAFTVSATLNTPKLETELISVNVYPNPMDQEATFEVKGPLNKQLTLNVYDMLGQVVRTEELMTNSTATIQRQNLASGMYIYRILDVRGQALKTGKIELR